ncbi:MAG: hypothetical protein RIG68_24575 [Imperialibacter sp.]|uniref:DUF6883 domain-containing protein n=1 Tax=Imperialibacter sp. TaxID=2038411 RepID=UPI0032EC493B
MTNFPLKLLPNHKNAIVSERKLREYCLNKSHPTGKYKARVFEAVLGLAEDDVGVLINAILDGIAISEAHEKSADKYGRRYSVPINIRIFDKEALLITGWIIPNSEQFPKLTSCYLKV